MLFYRQDKNLACVQRAQLGQLRYHDFFKTWLRSRAAYPTFNSKTLDFRRLTRNQKLTTATCLLNW